MGRKPIKQIKNEIIDYLHGSINIDHLKKGGYTKRYLESELETVAKITLFSISFDHMPINGKDRFALLNVKVDKINNISYDNFNLYVYYLDLKMTKFGKPKQNTIVIKF